MARGKQNYGGRSMRQNDKKFDSSSNNNKAVFKGRNNQKGNFKRYKGKRTDEDFDSMSSSPASATHFSRTNPADWYIPNETILNNVASIPFGTPVGGRNVYGEYGVAINDSSFPGIMTITVQNLPGFNLSETSPLNMALKNFYTLLRHRNSGSKTYDAVDYGMYYLAMDSALSYLSWMRRIYGFMNLKNVVSRFVPRALQIANGVDYDDILKNMALLRSYINQYALRLSSLCIPATTTYIARHMWMYEGLYADHVTEKAQLYLFKPAGFHLYEYDANDMPTLTWKPMKYVTEERDYLYTYSDIMNFGETLLGHILSGFGEEDFNIISADILKALGEGAIYSAVSMPDDYVVLPVYDESVLKQIQNASLTMNRNEVKAIYSNDVHNFDVRMYYDVDKIGQYLTCTARKLKPINGANADVIDKLLNLPTTNPDAREVIDATRLMTSGYTFSSSGTDYIGFFYGSELPLYLNIYRFEDRSEGWKVYQGSDITSRYSWNNRLSGSNFDLNSELSINAMDALSYGLTTAGVTPGVEVTESMLSTLSGALTDATDMYFHNILKQYVTEAMDAFNEISYLSNFDWHPFVWYNSMIRLNAGSDADASVDSETVSLYAKSFLGDVSNYAIIKLLAMKDMHEASLLKEFGMTDFGTYSA